MFTVRLSFCVILFTVPVFVSWQGILSTAVQPPTSVRSPSGDASRARRAASWNVSKLACWKKVSMNFILSFFHFSLRHQANITLFHTKFGIWIEKGGKFRSDFAFLTLQFKQTAINWIIRYHIIKYTWKSHLSVSGVIISTGNQILESHVAMGKHRRSDPHVLTAHLQGGWIKLLNALRSVTVLSEKHKPFPKGFLVPRGLGCLSVSLPSPLSPGVLIR